MSDLVSEPPQQFSDGEDDPVREGEVKARHKGPGPRGGRRRFEEGGVIPMQDHGGKYSGKLVTFCKYKDPNTYAVESINTSHFKDFTTLLDNLSDKLRIEKGAKYIYHWPDVSNITKLEQFQSGHQYIVASMPLRKSDVDAVYSKSGPSKGTWLNGKVKYRDMELIKKDPLKGSPGSSGSGSGNRKPLIVRLVCNSTRRRDTIILNTKTRDFETMMADEITNAVSLARPPACALYAFNDGEIGDQVRSISDLLLYKKYDTFLVCGQEKYPAKWAMPDTPGPVYPPRSRYIPAAIEYNGDISPRSSGVQNGLPVYNKNDTVKVKINGRSREYNRYMEGDENCSKPDWKLSLDWVYGYRGSDRTFNLQLLDTEELVYYVSTVVVLFDKHKNTQRHYTGHTEDITCLAIHPYQKGHNGGQRIATGQMQGRGPENGAHIRLWDTDDMSTYRVFGLGVFQAGITAISFTNFNLSHIDNDMMMVIEDSFRHTMSVWDVQTEKLMVKSTVLDRKTNTELVLGGCFYPTKDDILITYGRQHLNFWHLDWDEDHNQFSKILRDKYSGYTDEEIPTKFTCVAFSSDGDVITGDSNGSIMVWQKDIDDVFSLNREDSSFNAHQREVSCLYMMLDGIMLSCAGKEIIVWDSLSRYQNRNSMTISMQGNIHAIVAHNLPYEESFVYLGTDNNCIMEGYPEDRFSMLVQGHSAESVCMAVSSKEQTFISAGGPLVIKWSLQTHKYIWKSKVEGEKITAIAIDPRDRMLALGTKSGKVVMLTHYNNGQEILPVSLKKINALSFSLDTETGRRLAIASDDGHLHMCFVDNGDNIKHDYNIPVLQGLSVTNIDWSTDGCYLMTSTTDFQTCYWNVDRTRKPKILPNFQPRRFMWASHRSLVSHSVLGPWYNLDKGETIKSVDRSRMFKVKDKNLLVTGDNQGRIRLFRYPCSRSDAEYRGVKAYSGSVNAALFSADDRFVLTSASMTPQPNGELKTHTGMMQWFLDLPDVPHHFRQHRAYYPNLASSYADEGYYVQYHKY